MAKARIKSAEPTTDLFALFQARLLELQGEVVVCNQATVGECLLEHLSGEIRGTGMVLSKGRLPPGILSALEENSAGNITWLDAGTAMTTEALKAVLDDCEWVVASVDALLADSGSVVIRDDRHPSQLAFLLPSRLILVAAENQMFPDLAAYLETAQSQSGFVIISGPSRTADIEKKLVLGAHGPGALTVLLVNGWTADDG